MFYVTLDTNLLIDLEEKRNGFEKVLEILEGFKFFLMVSPLYSNFTVTDLKR